MNCLLSVTQAIEAGDGDLPALFAEIVRLLPPAWQHPDVCRARLIFDNQEYRSPAFHESSWHQTAEIMVAGQKRGVIEVHYIRRMPDCDEGAFLRDERTLLNAVAERVGRQIERHQMEAKLQNTIKELHLERTALQQSNAALHGVLERLTTEKKSTQEAIVTNVDKVLMPVLRALEQEIPHEQKKYVSLLKDNLAEITSPFADKLSRAFMSLTAVEIRICQMIRDGMTTKEIAQLRHVSPATVARQRERIRHKLGLTGTDANLATYLRTFLVERP
jgi:DNA-binding CsgD family transcriptional regulator